MALTRLGLVFPLNLENIEEIGCGGVNLDQVLIWLREGVCELDDFELLGPLEILCERGFVAGTAVCYGESGNSGSHLDVLGYLNASHLVQFVLQLVPIGQPPSNSQPSRVVSKKRDESVECCRRENQITRTTPG